MNGLLPKRARGRQSAEADAAYERQVSDFCALMLQIRSTMDFRVRAAFMEAAQTPNVDPADIRFLRRAAAAIDVLGPVIEQAMAKIRRMA
jgi:hypothetical protein